MKVLQQIAKSINKAKLLDIKIYETKNMTPLFDYVINATASTSRQLNAVIDFLKKDSAENQFEIRSIEGARGEIWILVDLYNVLVNVFIGEERERYQLDKLWADLPQFDFEELVK